MATYLDKSARLSAIMDTGEQTSGGRPKFRTLSWGDLMISAEAGDVYAAAQTLAGLAAGTLSEVRKTVTTLVLPE